MLDSADTALGAKPKRIEPPRQRKTQNLSSKFMQIWKARKSIYLNLIKNHDLVNSKQVYFDKSMQRIIGSIGKNYLIEFLNKNKAVTDFEAFSEDFGINAGKVLQKRVWRGEKEEKIKEEVKKDEEEPKQRSKSSQEVARRIKAIRAAKKVQALELAKTRIAKCK